MIFFENSLLEKEIEKLTKREEKLYSSIIELYNGPDKFKTVDNLTRPDIHNQYSIIHREYTKLSSECIEALKRAIFLQWYSMSEPSYLTGIEEINYDNISIVLKNLKFRLDNEKVDSELLWMLNYYFGWDDIFDMYLNEFNYKEYKLEDHNVPIIYKNIKRGQMGRYWNSIINR